ncbi:MAG: hypothetical protein A3F83_03470 [Candidatus Glassbacteria bacterium RIFCSPLOWO2_12_FULL_58_11]|uniref:Uncharacterized protein n=1 Tax=Candidatus Glassbacteria bacterium RIFCSPLOWO2_12_FULL_58_11 TaxID=1817867 RepID=A0A1F5YXF5_9BACT|nr:MAG: hypothetical protein A3F83_03470 [Candidatus Glassbacteria bacterium RIFCSPLOWO2_12_FULL_58_11]
MAQAPVPADSAAALFRLSNARLAEGDSSGALELLDLALDLDGNHWPALLARGNLRFVSGKPEQALADYTRALAAPEAEIRSVAYYGCGLVHLHDKNLRPVVEQFRLALENSPDNPGALYALAALGLQHENILGSKSTAKYLARLVCLNPLYRDAYRTWRDQIQNKTASQIRDVDACLERFLAEHPDSTAWKVDLCRDIFISGKPALALAKLDSLCSSKPDYLSPEVPLLRGRCYLALKDTARFQDSYFEALETAGRTGDFRRLFREAEPLISNNGYSHWESLRDDRSRKFFLKSLWSQLDLDPLGKINLRLAEHYNRLDKFEQKFRLQLPGTAYPEYPANVIERENLDYIRRGPKNEQKWLEGQEYIRPGLRNGEEWTEKGSRKTLSIPLRYWYFGESPSFINSDIMIRTDQRYADGSFPLDELMQTLQLQYFDLESIHQSPDFNIARFYSPEGGAAEMEFYQGGVLRGEEKPVAEIALFDPNWNLLERHASAVYDIHNPEGRSWLAVHQVKMKPGRYWFVARMSLRDGQKWIDRGLLQPSARQKGKLEISSIVLSSLPEEPDVAYLRNGEPLLPRPSSRFGRHEIIKVYLEICGLQSDSTGQRSYTESVDVTRIEEEENETHTFDWGLVRMKNPSEESATTSIKLNFTRYAEPGGGPVAEVFTLDPSKLSTGNYRLNIRIEDNTGRLTEEKKTFFNLTGR